MKGVLPTRQLAARTAALLALMLGAVLAPASNVRADREACISAHEEAQLMRLRGRYTAARERLLSCAQSACPALLRSDCITWLAEVDASLPSVVFAVADRDSRDLIEVRVLANGALLTERIDGRAVPLDPGVYTLRFEAPGYARLEQVVTVREGQKQRLIRVQLAPLEAGAEAAAQASRAHPAAEPRLIPISSYALGGTALASLGVGITLGALGKRELERLEPKCEADGCTRGEKQYGKRLYITADVAFGVSAGLAIAATWLYFTARGKRTRDKFSGSDGLSASFHGSGGLLTWRSEL